MLAIQACLARAAYRACSDPNPAYACSPTCCVPYLMTNPPARCCLDVGSWGDASHAYTQTPRLVSGKFPSRPSPVPVLRCALHHESVPSCFCTAGKRAYAHLDSAPRCVLYCRQFRRQLSLRLHLNAASSCVLYCRQYRRHISLRPPPDTEPTCVMYCRQYRKLLRKLSGSP